MNRLTTDSPQDNFSTALNYVFSQGGWAHIRSDGEHDNILLTDWAAAQCLCRGCDNLPRETPEEIDAALCECAVDFPECPIALAYCFASQACHLRDRLKMYEDSGLDPTGKPLEGPGKC